MNRYPKEEIGFKELVKRSLSLHYLTLKQVIVCVLVITIVKYFSMMLSVLYPEPMPLLINMIVSLIFYVYFFAAALLAAHRIFIDQPISISVALATVWRRGIRIFTTFFVYVFGLILVFYFAKLTGEGVLKLLHINPSLPNQGVIFYMAILCLLFLALFYFAFPITVINDKPVQQAFYDSVVLSEKNKFGILMSICILFIAYVLMTPKMVHAYLLAAYHLDVVFDFIVLCVAIPLYINAVLLLINDSKRQVRMD